MRSFEGMGRGKIRLRMSFFALLRGSEGKVKKRFGDTLLYLSTEGGGVGE